MRLPRGSKEAPGEPQETQDETKKPPRAPEAPKKSPRRPPRGLQKVPGSDQKDHRRPHAYEPTSLLAH